jgi:hypothetical protein
MATATRKKPTKLKISAPARVPRGKKAGITFDGWESMSGEEYHRFVRIKRDELYSNSKASELEPEVLAWMKENGYKKDDIDAVKRRGASITTAITCKLLRSGMPDLNEKHKAYWEELPGTMGEMRPVSEHLKKSLQEAIVRGRSMKVEVVDETKPVVKKETIQDRLAEKFSETLGEIEGAIDDFMLTGKEVKAFNILSTANIAVQYASKVADFIQPRIDELNELLEGKDAQLKEGYAHLGKRDVKAHIKMYETIINDAMAYKTSKIATRAKPKRKPVPPEKQVRGLKYLKEFADLGLKSINPTEILGMSELWVYNTKTRKLGRFVVPMHGDMAISQLGVKGSAIIGFDEINSTAKTLRKPAEKLAEFKTLGKPALRKFMSTIKSVEVKLKGRIGPDTILLRAIK